MLKQQAEVEQKGKEKKKKDALQTLKTTVLVSAVIVAVAGVVFAVTKKLREKWASERQQNLVPKFFRLVLDKNDTAIFFFFQSLTFVQAMRSFLLPFWFFFFFFMEVVKHEQCATFFLTYIK